MNYKLRELASLQAQVLQPGECRVGREDIMDFILSGDSVSRHHANLHNTEDGIVWVTDMGSTNGTFVNGQPVKEWTRVIPGQTVSFGEESFRLENEVDEVMDERPSENEMTEINHRKVASPKNLL